MRRLFPFLLLALLPLPAEARAENPPETAIKMADSINRFALDVYRSLGRGDNLFFSPYSISSALGMTREGARGETAAEMDRVFHYPAQLAAHQGALAKALRPPLRQEWDAKGKRKKVPAYALNIANALWGQTGLRFHPAFAKALKEEYGAPLHRIDFGDQPAARKAINDWVEKETRDKIKNIVPRGAPPPSTRLVLANAIYFKANWSDKFSKGGTKERPWHKLDGSKSKAKLMRSIDGYGYTEDDDVQVAELPYRGNVTSMVVILPKKKDGLAALEEKLGHEQLKTWIGGLRHRKLDLSLPRWKFTSANELSTTLKGLGMPLAFTPAADFSGMTDADRLSIGLVLHKAFIAVDEEGTEAAAATVVMMPTGAIEAPKKPMPFVADHPFVFLIRHRATGAILFMGRLVEPEAE